MANQDSRLDEHEEIVELNEAPQEEEKRVKGYEDYVTQEPEDVVEPPKEEDDLPEKYRNKDVRDIVSMHQNAEKLLGKQATEVGELRKVVDDFIKAQTETKQNTAPVTEEDDDLDFFENPKAAVAKLLENHPSVKQSQEMTKRLAQQEALSKLKSNHPDFKDIVQDSGFSEWVQKSKIRTQLLQRADAYDFDSADELFTTWKERQALVNDTVKNETKARKQAVKSGSTGNVSGSGERPSRKIYRRADIVELMTKDPQRYQALASEIRQAYAEGRVK
jgi:hypothetical protein